MTIPAETIRSWSERPGSFLPSWTKEVLENALNNATRLREYSFEVFVQGSYANKTNIRGDSDVDLVIKMRLPFEENIYRLNAAERERFFERYGDTFYGWEEFRADVVASLRKRFFVHEGRKCIDIKDWDSALRIPADILPAIEYRRYSKFPAFGEEVYEEGVFFRDSKGDPIVNFPKQHRRNGQKKDRNTGGRYKEIVRVVKNARKHAGTDGRTDFNSAKAPSYFVECLLYNVPDAIFRAPLPAAYGACLNWLDTHRATMAEFRCQNELVELFGERSDQWSVESANNLITALKERELCGNPI
jgi:hypothetical protein